MADTHVHVLAIVTVKVLEGCEMWLAFGYNKNFKYIAAHTIVADLGDDSVQGLVVHPHLLKL